jgi:APA family basic amino acid/polyamine antiporter
VLSISYKEVSAGLEKLKREISLVSATSYVLGVIIGAGIYVLVGKAAGITGNSVWLAFLISAFIAACTGLSYAELASTFPYDSAEYVYTERAFKDRRFSFGICWLKLVTTIIATSAVALGFGGYLSFLTGWGIVPCALLLILILTIFNMIGAKQALWFDTLLVVLAVAGLLLVIFAGAPQIKGFDSYLEMPAGFSGLFTAAGLVFFAFLGFENVGNIAEEVKNPRRNLPLALIISVLISTLLYVLVAVVAVSVIPWQILSASASPLSDVMSVLIGTKAGWVMAIMAIGATASTVIGLLIATSRMIYGLAEEHSMPSFFLKLTKKNKVPYVAVLLTSLICAIFILPGDIAAIAFLTDFGALFIFLVVNLCVIMLRYSHDHVPRAFRVPLNIGKFPIIPSLGLASCAALLFTFSKKMFFVGILFFLSGMLLYSIFGGRGSKPETAEPPKAKMKSESGLSLPKKKKQHKKV